MNLRERVKKDKGGVGERRGRREEMAQSNQEALSDLQPWSSPSKERLDVCFLESAEQIS